jgi:hypothetical protein
VRQVVIVVGAVVAAGAVIAIVLAVGSGGGCDDLRFDRAEWAKGDRDEIAACVVEVQPFRGLENEAVIQRLGPPDERRRAELRWWIGADDDFGMKIETLAIPIDVQGRAGRARIARSG